MFQTIDKTQLTKSTLPKQLNPLSNLKSVQNSTHSRCRETVFSIGIGLNTRLSETLAGETIQRNKNVSLITFMTKKLSNPFVNEFWEETFNCSLNPNVNSLKPCTGSERLENVKTPLTDMSQLRYSYNSYLAVYAVAHGLKDMQACVPGHGPFINSSCAIMNDFNPWQVGNGNLYFKSHCFG